MRHTFVIALHGLELQCYIVHTARCGTKQSKSDMKEEKAEEKASACTAGASTVVNVQVSGCSRTEAERTAAGPVDGGSGPAPCELELPCIEGDICDAAAHEGYYYVAPGKTLTLVSMCADGFYLWFGGADVRGRIKSHSEVICGPSVIRNRLSRNGKVLKFTAWDKGTGGYLFVSGRHVAIQVLKGAPVLAEPSAGYETIRSFTGEVELHAGPGAVLCFGPELCDNAIMLDSLMSQHIHIDKEHGLRVYGQVGAVVVSSDGVRANGKWVSELEADKASVRVSKNGSALDVTVSLPDRFAHKEYADIVLEGVYSICTKLQEHDKRNAS